MLAARVAKLVALRKSARAERKLAVVLFNFPPNGGSAGTAAYLSVFESLHNTMKSLKAEGYTVDVPATVDELRGRVLKGNAQRFGTDANVAVRIPVDNYVRRERWLAEIEKQWGAAPGRHQTDGGNILVLGSPLQRNVSEGVTHAQAADFALDTLSQTLSALEENKVYLCLEPLTKAETNFMTCAAEGVALARELAHPFVKLHLDVKAMSVESAPTPAFIRANREFLHHFHANDPNKRGPGFGNTDFKPIFQPLADVNYSGWVSVEVFDYSPDPDTIARESIRYMRECQA